MSETIIIHLLVSGEYDGRGVVGAFETPELAYDWLGRATLAGTAPRGPFELETCEYSPAPDPLADQPDVNPVGVHLGEPAVSPNAERIERLAAIIGYGRTGRAWSEVGSTPGGIKDRATAWQVVQHLGAGWVSSTADVAVDPEGLDRAAQVHRYGEVNPGRWASEDGLSQASALAYVRPIIRAYLREDES